jgi:rhodanese-related sulfurtransferase
MASGSEIENVPSVTAWERLAADSRAQLIDVRTKAEWAFVGLPVLSSIGREPILQEWQTFPDQRVDPDFASRLASTLEKRGAARDDELFFLCRSGGRSHMAAQAMAARGFTRCRNVADGFEGGLDAERHRGRVSGWKVCGLPWAQG